MSDMLIKSPEFIRNEFYDKLAGMVEYIHNFDKLDKDFTLLNDTELHVYAWSDCEEFIYVLGQQCSKYTGIVGVPRGGTILATMLSYRSGLPLLVHPQPGCLIIDDACVTGAALIPYYHRFDIAVMWVRQDSPIVPTYAYDSQNNWKGVKFPWQI